MVEEGGGVQFYNAIFAPVVPEVSVSPVRKRNGVWHPKGAPQCDSMSFRKGSITG